jgi:autophagy-related protein 2
METMKLTQRIASGAQHILEVVDVSLGGSHRRSGPTSVGTPAATTHRIRNATPPRDATDGLRQARAAVTAAFNAAGGLFAHVCPPPQAYEALSRGLQAAAHNMVVVPREEYARSGAGASVKTVLKAVPGDSPPAAPAAHCVVLTGCGAGAILRPMIGATEAIAKAMMGLQNSVEPRRKLDTDDKWKA